MNQYLLYASIVCATTYSLSRFCVKRVENKMNYQKGSLFAFEKPKTREYYNIVHNPNYDISFAYLEKLHYFDSHKWTKVYNYLQTHFREKGQKFSSISPLRYISNEELELVHTKQFVKNIHESNSMIAKAAEVFVLRFIPNYFLQNNLVTPLKWQTAGSVLAAHQALIQGWAINIGGGFHHASAATAEGFCFFADITLIMRYLWDNVDHNLKFMIVDLDAHQGNGYERDKFGFMPDENEKVFIFDMYNKDIYPQDKLAMATINHKVELSSNTDSDNYMFFLKVHFEDIFKEFKPNLIIYNAGTDVLEGDPLGHLGVKPPAIIERDEFIFNEAKKHNIPIVMLTSGGYQQSNAKIIADSIINLIEKGLIYTRQTSSNVEQPKNDKSDPLNKVVSKI